MLEKAKILKNELIAEDVYKMELECEMTKLAKPGQFIEIQIPEFYLRRPISICEIKENTLVIIYKVFGEGTKVLSTLKDEVSILGPLGNGFKVEKRDSLLIVGGGIGVPPLYELCKQYRKLGTDVKVVMGYLNANQMILKDEFEALGAKVIVATDDGSYGVKGNVIDAINQNQISDDYIMACGPLGMLKGLSNKYQKGYLSLEQRMACGVGACMGCVVKGNDGKAYRVCKDGPVFEVGKVEL